MDKYKVVRRQRFDLNSAQTDVWYELHKQHINWRKHVSWRPVKKDSYGGMRTVQGDFDWACRIAKHLGLDVPSK